MTAMQGGGDSTARLRELAAQIAAEQDHDKFTALVKEFNDLVDGKDPLSDRGRIGTQAGRES
jgi:hypothetical protein